jgi:hypothetical protein
VAFTRKVRLECPPGVGSGCLQGVRASGEKEASPPAGPTPWRSRQRARYMICTRDDRPASGLEVSTTSRLCGGLSAGGHLPRGPGQRWASPCKHLDRPPNRREAVSPDGGDPRRRLAKATTGQRACDHDRQLCDRGAHLGLACPRLARAAPSVPDALTVPLARSTSAMTCAPRSRMIAATSKVRSTITAVAKEP